MRLLLPSLIVVLASCSSDEQPTQDNKPEQPTAPLSTWIYATESVDFVSALAAEGELEIIIGMVEQGIFVYFYDSQVNCNNTDVSQFYSYSGAAVKVFYPKSGDTYKAPASVTFKSSGLANVNEKSSQYTGELALKEADNEDVLSGWLNISAVGYEQDSMIVGSFEATKCF